MYSSTSETNKTTDVPRGPSWTLGLAFCVVLAVLLQQLGQDALVLLVPLLCLLPAGMGGHGGGQLPREKQWQMAWS